MTGKRFVPSYWTDVASRTQELPDCQLFDRRLLSKRSPPKTTLWEPRSFVERNAVPFAEYLVVVPILARPGADGAEDRSEHLAVPLVLDQDRRALDQLVERGFPSSGT